MTLVHWDDVDGFDIPEGLQPLGGRWQRLGDAAGSVRLGAQRVLAAPGQMITPPHKHTAEEEIYHVVSGSATLWQGGETCLVAAGDTIVYAAGSPAHTLIAGDSGLEVLIFGQRLTPEAGTLPRTGVAWLADASVQILDVHPWEAEVALGVPEGTAVDRPPNVIGLNDVEGDYDGRWKRLAHAGGATQTGLNCGVLAASEEGSPPHCHSADEEIFVILEGEGTLELWSPPRVGVATQTVPDETHAVRHGHVIVRPAATRVSHCLRSGEAGLTYLAYGTREPNDICYYPRSNKVFFRGIGLIARLEPLAYSDGEPG